LILLLLLLLWRRLVPLEESLSQPHQR